MSLNIIKYPKGYTYVNNSTAEDAMIWNHCSGGERLVDKTTLKDQMIGLIEAHGGTISTIEGVTKQDWLAAN